MRNALLIAALGGLAALTLIGLAAAWTRVDIAIPLFGWIAIGVGALIAAALGFGLMALSFFSARAGYDERANHDLDDPGP